MTSPKRGLDSFQNAPEFLFTCVGFILGLHNIWTFPGVLQTHGGMCFLIPYFVCLLFLGFPLIMMELTIGRRFQGSFVHVFGRMNKFLWGLGVSMIVMCLYTSAFYATNAGYAIIYVIKSFERPLPWMELHNNQTDSFPAQVFSYYYQEILETDEDLEDMSHTKFLWKIFLASLPVWVVVFLCLFSGLKSLGKVAYFLVLFPVSVLITLLVIGLNRKNGFKGVKDSFDSDFSMLLDADTWLLAFEQVIFGSALGFGSWVSLASRSPIRRCVLMDSFIILLIKVSLTFVVAIAVFAINGNLASELEKHPIPDYPADHPINGKFLIYFSLAYFADTVGDARWVVSLAAVLFYFSIFVLSLSPISVFCENIVFVFSTIKTLQKVPYFVKLGTICFLGASISCLFCTSHGHHFLEMFEKYGFHYPVLLISLFQLVAVGWVHGIHNFSRDFGIVSDFQPYWILKLIWKYLSPLAILVASAWKCVQDGKDDSLFVGPTQLENTFTLFSPSLSAPESYPTWAIILCAVILGSILLWVPLGSLISCCVSIDFGRIRYDEKRLISLMEPKEYSCLERVVCCISEEFDFPENITLRYAVPFATQNGILEMDAPSLNETRNSSMLNELEDFTIFSETTRF